MIASFSRCFLRIGLLCSLFCNAYSLRAVETWRYSYDDAKRLSQALETTGGGFYYSYDESGNRMADSWLPVGHSNQPPAAPHHPTPADGGELDYSQPLLTWQAHDPDAGEILYYDVYLGAKLPLGLARSGVHEATVQLAPLSGVASYLWQVVAIDARGARTQGPIWSFRPADTDHDGLYDHIEAKFCTDKLRVDTDNDGLNDGVEDANKNGRVDAGETHPCQADSDKDGVPDGWEVRYGLNPLLAADARDDKDGDGFTNLEEFMYASDPTSEQSKPNVWVENFEQGAFKEFYWIHTTGDKPWIITEREPLEGRYAAQSGAIGRAQQTVLETYVHAVNPVIGFWLQVSSEKYSDKLYLYVDSEKQGEWSGELPYQYVTVSVRPGKRHIRWVYVKDGSFESGQDMARIDQVVLPGPPDFDADGFLDGWEYHYFAKLDQDMTQDSDGDGFTNEQEYRQGTNPLSIDSDADGMSDDWEIRYGFDPLQAKDAQEDKDSDGFINVEEYFADTNPGNSTSLPKGTLVDFEQGTFSPLTWQQGGHAPWIITQDFVQQGQYAAKAGTITGSQTSHVEATVNGAGGLLRFYVAISSEAIYDKLQFFVDDTLQQAWSGEHGYQVYRTKLSAGTHRLRWEYSKNGFTVHGRDMAWLDQVFVPISTDISTSIISNPVSIAYLSQNKKLPFDFFVMPSLPWRPL